MKKAIVTGGAGFIGSHLVKRLLKLNYDVIVVDDLSQISTIYQRKGYVF